MDVADYQQQVLRINPSHEVAKQNLQAVFRKPQLTAGVQQQENEWHEQWRTLRMAAEDHTQQLGKRESD